MVFTKKNEEAVSPVIGVILMVAITVILAATVAYFVFDLAGGIQKPNIVAVSMSRTSSGVSAVFVGGQGAPYCTNVNFTVNNVVVGSFQAPSTTNVVPVGNRITFSTPTNPAQIIAIGYFNNGPPQMLSDQLI